MENKNPNKIIDIDEKILDFNKHQKGKGLKLQTRASEQRLPIALAQARHF